MKRTVVRRCQSASRNRARNLSNRRGRAQSQIVSIPPLQFGRWRKRHHVETTPRLTLGTDCSLSADIDFARWVRWFDLVARCSTEDRMIRVCFRLMTRQAT